MRINFVPVIALCAMTAGFSVPSSAGDIVVASGHLTSEQIVDRVFTSVERRILRRYYEARQGSSSERESGSMERGYKGQGGKHKGKKNKGMPQGKKNKGMPPGLAKRGGNLPPGLAKRGDDLPPGLAKRLPRDLMHELPPRSSDYRRVVVDNDIVLIDAATNKVLDILEDALLGGG